jgi:hypothetical protein
MLKRGAEIFFLRRGEAESPSPKSWLHHWLNEFQYYYLTFQLKASKRDF